MDSQQAIRDLRVIGMLQQNDKLGIDTWERLYIDQPGRMQWLRRLCWRNNRDVTLRLVRIVIDTAVTYVQFLWTLPNSQAQFNLAHVLDAIEKAELGLVHLEATY